VSQPHKSAGVIFDVAVELSGEQRAAYLEEACAGDEALRQRVEALLRAHEAAGTFMQGPAAERLPPTLVDALPPTEKPGDRIGRYRLLQQIGEGGCGVVYMAEQEEPVRRRVALKVIKLGMDTKSVIARFEAERQALALMDHPNIARVLDAGATDTGGPYFVMELVRGIKITDYCDENNLPTQQRLNLFIQVCQAIQHAHQKGIIHRDIKPSNILVTVNNDVAVPKVIDFGIAKATQGRLTDHTVFTAFEQFLGTPAYMSPEQGGMTSLDIDTRSDIYSLGVLLYELLTGKTPFELKELLAAGLDEMRRTIREKEPPKPSTRLSTMLGDELTTTARRRQTDVPKLVHSVRGDLDWIVMKCLEKDRGRRYDSANGLSSDILRHLNREPITARPPAKLYRLQRLVQRNKLAFSAVAAVAAALIVGLAVSMWLLFKERAAHRLAMTEAVERLQVTQFFQEMLKGVGPEVAMGRNTQLLREVLNRTEKRVLEQLTNQPRVQARVLDTISYVYWQLGDYDRAENLARLALAPQDAIAGAKDETAVHLLQTLGKSKQQSGDFAGAEASLRQAVEVAKKLPGDKTPAVTSTLISLGELLGERGDLAGAEAALRSALTNANRLQDSDQGIVGVGLNDLGLVLGAQNDLAGAEDCYRRCLVVDKKILGDDAPQVAVTLDNLGMTLWQRLDLSGAEMAIRGSLALKQKVLPPGHPQLANSMHNLALVLRDRGDLTGAESNQVRALEIMTKSVGDNHPNTGTVADGLAIIRRRRGTLTREIALLEASLDLNPTGTMGADALASMLADRSLVALAGSVKEQTTWRFTSNQPPPNWAEQDFPDTTWTPAAIVSGFPTNSSPRTSNAATPRTNLWLRQAFELNQVPTGKLVFRLNRNHDGEVFINGVAAARAADWSDAERLYTCSAAAQATLAPGRNVIALHCEDADGAAPIGVVLFQTMDADSGWSLLSDEFSQAISRQPARSSLYAGRAYPLLRSGHYREAIQDLNKAIELNPADQASCCLLLSLLAATGEREAFARKRHAALVQFAGISDPDSLEHLARAALLLPGEKADLEPALRMAHQAAKAEYFNGNLLSRQLTESLAHYREGDFAGAIEWARKATTTGSNVPQPGWSHQRMQTLACAAPLLEAMPHQRLRRTAEAQAGLSASVDRVKTQFVASDATDLSRAWPDGIFVQVLIREAQSLIQPIQSVR
jgi:serine/threonine protein kinase/tetratricopeptide (TPR) repeat protein